MHFSNATASRIAKIRTYILPATVLLRAHDELLPQQSIEGGVRNAPPPPPDQSCAILQNCARSGGGLQTSSASIDVVAADLRVVDDVLVPGALVAHPRCSRSAS